MSDGRCGFEKDDGDRCAVDWGLCDKCSMCFHHCPHREKERQEAKRRGGHEAARKNADGPKAVHPDAALPTPQSLNDGVQWAAWAAHAVATGELDTARANSVARLLKEFRQGLERAEAREALEELEELRQKIEGGPDLEVVEGD